MNGVQDAIRHPEIKPATGFRAVAVLGVVLYHTNMPLSNYPIGYFLTILFVFSGFFMSMHYRVPSSISYQQWTQFMMNRCARFIPLYWISLALVIAFSQWSWRWDLPLHILLLQSYVPNLSIAYSFNGVAWFLSSLLFCYALFPFVNRIFQNYSMPLILGIILSLIISFDLIASLCEIRVYKYMTHTFPIKHLIEFMAGMLIYHFYERHKHIHTSTLVTTILELLTITIVVLYILIGTIGAKDMLAMWWLTPSVITTLCLVILCQSHGLINRFLSSAPLLFVGRLSYEIYIFQYLVIMATKKFVAWADYPYLNMTMTRFIIIGASILLAYVLHHFITLPIQHQTSSIAWLRCKFRHFSH